MGKIYDVVNIGGSGSGGTAITRILSGQLLDPTTAAEGVYFLEPGSTLLNGPQNVGTMYSALVTVRIQTISVNLIALCDFTGNTTYGEWELLDIPAWQGYAWAPLYSSTTRPMAAQDYIIVDIYAPRMGSNMREELKQDNKE